MIIHKEDLATFGYRPAMKIKKLLKSFYDHPQGDLATFGYRPAMKIKIYRNLFMIVHKKI